MATAVWALSILETDREAAVLGILNECDAPPPKAANDVAPTDDDEQTGEDDPFICPVTSQPCMTEEDEFCEDYGCARKAGIDVDRDGIL